VVAWSERFFWRRAKGGASIAAYDAAALYLVSQLKKIS
jgi:hypothetical protein